jgi:imidazolonepropionase-like amidohydrolase
MRRAFPLLVVLAAGLTAQTESGTVVNRDSGSFRLYKFEQPIGEETYTVLESGGALELQSTFEFTDRGTKVPLKATLRAAPDYTPRSFTISGSTSRLSKIDTSVTPDPAKSGPLFTIAGYAPVAIQQSLIRYWRAHGQPASLPILPAGAVQIRSAGAEEFTIAGGRATFERYRIGGLVWGVETLWMDGRGNLAALVTRDAEFDHFEAIRQGYESALEQFVSAAARDAVASLGETARAMPGRLSGTFAVVGATLIDGTNRPPIPNATVLVRDGRIAAAGPARSVRIPGGVARIDAAGKFIIPGLWDMHAHFEQVEWGPIYLAAGVTTVRDAGNEFEFIAAVRDRIKAGEGLGPRLLLAGIVDGDGPSAIGVTRVNSPEDAVRWVRKYHDAGFEQIKIYSSMKPDNVKAVAREAHRLGMTVTGHVPNGMTIYDGVEAGMDQVSHITYSFQALFPANFDFRKATPEERMAALQDVDPAGEQGRRLIAFLKEHGTVLDDTVVLYELNSHPDNVPVSTFEPGVANVAPELREQFAGTGVPPARAPYAALNFRKSLDWVGILHRAGIPLVAGTDQAVPGYSVDRELELYVQAGFTPLEAIQAATIVPARAMKRDSDSGTVEPGKRADFDILDRNPLQDIHNIRAVHRVVAGGVLYDPAPLWKAAGFTPPAAR